MDKKQSWSWLPDQMPGVAKLMATQRAKHGAEHLAECWRRGVLQLEPGWFYAREGALAVGTPWTAAVDAHLATGQAWAAGRALLVIHDHASGMPEAVQGGAT